MAKHLAVDVQPQDPAAFDRYDFDRHLASFASGGVDILVAETKMV